MYISATFFSLSYSYLLILLAIFFILSIFKNLILFYLFTCNTFSVTYRLSYWHCSLTIIIFGIQHTFLCPPPAISHPCLNSVHRFTPVRTSYVSTSLLPFPLQTWPFSNPPTQLLQVPMITQVCHLVTCYRFFLSSWCPSPFPPKCLRLSWCTIQLPIA